MKHISLFMLCMSAAIIMQSQEIQTIPSDPAVRSGVLPNGLTYYVVTNPQYKGVVDFALAQRTGSGSVPGEDPRRAVSVSQQALTSQPGLLSPTVQDFFIRHGVVPGADGFVKVTDNATVFRFEKMFIADKSELMDSTLLVMMNIAGRGAGSTDAFLKKWYAPSDQAMILSGDMDAAKVIEKLKMLSYMVPASVSEARQTYVWEEKGMSVVMENEDLRDIVTVTALWSLQRTPREFMNTVQPVIYERFMTELGIVAEHRLAASLRMAGIPCGGISYDFQNGVESLDDEKFSVSLSVSPSDLRKAVSVMASVMSGIDGGDVTVEEIKRAERIFMDGVVGDMVRRHDNKEYVDRCIAAFIYNYSLASASEMLHFHTSRAIDDETGLSLFQSVVSASIDPSRNLVIKCSGKLSDDTSEDSVAEAFRTAWDRPFKPGNAVMQQEPMLWEAGEKVKIKSAKKDYMSEGTILTLSNGFKVIFKKMPVKDMVYYSLVLNGGYGNLSDIRPGDGAYISDYLDFCTIGGVDSDTFRDVARRNGMTMDFKVGMSRASFQGRVKDDALEYLLKALLTVVNDRAVDREAFASYLACEPLKLEMRKGEAAERLAAIDSIICPGYVYTSYKAPGRLSGSLADRADALIDNLSSKMNDAVLVLVGDVDEILLRKVLTMYAGEFKVRNRAFSRPVVNYQPVSGEVMYTLDGSGDSVDIVLSAPMALTADNYYTAAVAGMALRKNLIQSVSGTGMTLTLMSDFSKYPQERFSLKISLVDASVEGFAPGTAVKDPVEAMNIVRRRLDRLVDMEISAAELSAYKALLKNIMKLKKDTPEYWLKAISMRYLDGKDLSTGCDARIDAVTADRMRTFLKAMIDGARVEYIVKNKK